jgi:hypothetical protein
VSEYYERTFAFAERTKAKGEEVRQEFDSVVSALDQVEVDIKRAIKLPVGFDVELDANDSSRAGRVLGFDENGDPVLQQGVGRWRGNYAPGSDYAVRDFFKDSLGAVGLNNIYIVTTAFTAVSLAAETSNIEILFDSAQAEQFVAEAKTAKDAAETAQAAAGESASTASDGADIATTQASIATTQAGISSSSATAAVNAQSYAEEWAAKSEDELISTAAGGNGADDYSARHWSIKSQDSADAAEVSAVNAAASAAAVENERLNWIEGGYQSDYAYQVNDAFSSGGSSYVVINAVTGVAPPDNSYYDLLAAQGAAGPGTGDVLAANNLSDLASAATARSNLNINAANTPFNNSGTPLSATNTQTAIAESITRLGTAATTNKQTSITDSTAGRLLIVGVQSDLLTFNNSGSVLSATNVEAAIKQVQTNLNNFNLSAYAPLASPSFTGTPTAPTQSAGDSSTRLATTAFVKNQNYAPIASPPLTGNPTSPTPGTDSNSTRLATTAFVRSAIAAYSPEYTPPTTFQALNTYATTDSTLQNFNIGSAYSAGSLPGLTVGTWRITGISSQGSSAQRYLALRIA